MGDFITALLSSVTINGIWGAIAPAAPLIGVAVLVSIGYMVLRRSVGGIGKGKAKV